MRAFVLLVSCSILAACATSFTEGDVSRFSDYQLCRYSIPSHPLPEEPQMLVDAEIAARALDCAPHHQEIARQREHRQLIASFRSPAGRAACPPLRPTGNGAIDAYMAGRAIANGCQAQAARSNNQACLTYVSTGASYVVDASAMSGADLNRATDTMGYNVFAGYVVVFWGPNESSIIQIEGVTTPGLLPAMPTTGFDQSGREWRVSRFQGLCG